MLAVARGNTTIHSKTIQSFKHAVHGSATDRRLTFTTLIVGDKMASYQYSVSPTACFAYVELSAATKIATSHGTL